MHMHMRMLHVHLRRRYAAAAAAATFATRLSINATLATHVRAVCSQSAHSYSTLRRTWPPVDKAVVPTTSRAIPKATFIVIVLRVLLIFT